MGSRVVASGFDAYDGRAVTAVFAMRPSVVKTAAARVERGAFGFEFLFAGGGCSLGAPSYAGGAIHVDVDGDGACSPDRDLVFVWDATGGPHETSVLLPLMPSSPPCTLVGYAADALFAAQQVCPAVGSCLDFCGPIESTSAGLGAVCPSDGGVEYDAGTPIEDAGGL